MYKKKLAKVRIQKHRMRKRYLKMFEQGDKDKTGKNFYLILYRFLFLEEINVVL